MSARTAKVIDIVSVPFQESFCDGFGLFLNLLHFHPGRHAALLRLHQAQVEHGGDADLAARRDAFISQRSAHFRFTLKDRLTSSMTIIYDILLCHFAVTWRSLQFALSLQYTGKWPSSEPKNHSSLGAHFAFSLGQKWAELPKWTESELNSD